MKAATIAATMAATSYCFDTSLPMDEETSIMNLKGRDFGELENWGLAQFGYGTAEAELSQIDVAVDLQVTMSISFKWPSRKKPSSSSRSRSAVARKPRGKDALSARKPASGWTIKLTGLKTSLA